MTDKKVNQLLNIHQIAAMCGVSARTISRWRVRGDFPETIRLPGIAGNPRWRARDIEAWIDSRGRREAVTP